MRRFGIRYAMAVLLWLGTAAVAWGGQTHVVFDQGHGQPFTIMGEGPLDLSGLAALFRGEGCRVEAVSGPLDDEMLGGADVLVSAAPFHPYSPAEIESVLRFLDRGGRLALLLHVPPPAVGLLDRLAVAHSNAPIRERDGVIGGDPLNFKVSRISPGSLKGMKGFSLFGAWALRPLASEVRPLATTGPRAWVDLDGNKAYSPHDAQQSFAVAVTGTRGKGRYVVFGDDTAFQNRFLRQANTALGRSLVRWLKGN